MKKILLFIAIFAVSLNMQAQEKMFVWQNGVKTDFVVTDVDSITFNQLTGNGHEYVDLGLPSGTLWATCNVGATKPEEYGDYFAWGETQPKDYYDWSTYKWCNGSFNTQTKYNTNSSYGTVDNKTTLDLSDDAARANWGGSWRMPTDAELTELREQCTWTWTTQNGVYGHKVTSKKSGYTNKSIFLPAAGVRSGSSLIDAGSYGSYRSSSLITDYPYGAWDVYFLSDDVSRGCGYRDYGFSVRPVCTQNSMSQREMYIWQNGGKTTFVVADVDSVTFSGSNLTNPTTPNGGIGVFSIAEDKTVTFSPGNLQYHPANDEWRFAENQTDYIGEENSNCSLTYNGWLDLFGWSTRRNKFGVSTSTDFSDYYVPFVDWGRNKIGNDVPNTWRTLSSTEWDYLLNTRANASSLIGIACVNNVNGLILLPDNWTCPSDVTFKSGFYGIHGVDYFAAYQTFTADQWSKLESAGAVFLPASGNRYGSNINLVRYCGYYWSASVAYDKFVYSPGFDSEEVIMFSNFCCYGQSVRLVKDIDGSNTPNNPNDDPDNPNNPNDNPDDSDDPIVITGVTVKAKVPAHWIDLITVWVWPTGGEGEEFIPVREGDWYVYTHTAGTELNIIFKNGFGWTGAHNQTIDITGITQNTCIKIEQEGSGKATYTIVDCLSGEEDEEEDDEKPEKPDTLATGMENGYEWVDLGLSVKWATCNVGASKPEEYGDYFAWGETQPKDYYDWSTYKWCNGSYWTLTKYCTDSYYGTVDNKTTLELSDDAARANWGGSWRMPTDAELTELREQCTWTWTTQNGVYGYKVTSKKSGYTNKSIFLPAAGFRYDSSLSYAGSDGVYWSSSLDTGRPLYAWYVYFNSDGVDWNYGDRYYGFSVRPVYGEYIPASTLPTVTTSSATNISATSVTIGGNVTSDGGTSVTERGVVYSTSQNPTTANSKVTSGSGTGSFICSLTNLQEGTTYYVRAYATNEKGTSYGNQVVFTTLESPIENVHEYVDLGLSVKWATCNVGATKPEEYGDYFAWGETEPKSIYDWSTYKWCRGSSDTQTKYCINSSYGTVDNKTTLELSDDAARANWGGSWRMPTDAELTELREQCIWTWTSQNGVYGYKVTSKKSGYTNKSIFLPAAGRRNDSSLNDAGSVGDYWSSSLYTGCPISVCGLYFDLYNNVDWGYSSRQQGHSVRPVCQ